MNNQRSQPPAHARKWNSNLWVTPFRPRDDHLSRKGLEMGRRVWEFYTMNAVKVDSAKRIRLTVLTPGDYYEPEVRGGDAEEITLRRMPPPRRRFTKLEALRAIERSPLRFSRSWDQVKEETRR
jgi:hypothetical protein